MDGSISAESGRYMGLPLRNFRKVFGEVVFFPVADLVKKYLG